MSCAERIGEIRGIRSSLLIRLGLHIKLYDGALHQVKMVQVILGIRLSVKRYLIHVDILVIVLWSGDDHLLAIFQGQGDLLE